MIGSGQEERNERAADSRQPGGVLLGTIGVEVRDQLTALYGRCRLDPGRRRRRLAAAGPLLRLGHVLRRGAFLASITCARSR